MKVLITGGTGFIGSRLALEARERGLQVVVAGQVNNAVERMRCEELLRAGIGVDEGPLQEPVYVRRMVDGCEAVIHLAAAQHEANVPDSHFETVNVAGTRTLLEAGVAAGVRRFVHGSTIGIYGDGAGGVLDEQSPPRPTNVYGRTKLAAESAVTQIGGELQTVIVRISETYGPGDFRLLKLFRAIQRGRFLLIGGGSNQRQVIHVQDLVRLLLLAAEAPAAVGQTVIGAGDQPMTTRQMVEQIARAINSPVPRFRAPLWPFLALAVAMEGTLKPLGIDPPLHRRRLDFFRKSFVFDTSKARALLDFRPRVSFEEGAAQTAAWYRARGYLGA